MLETKGYYCLVQFCPDQGKEEFANIGVLLFDPDRHFLSCLLAPSNQRILRRFPQTAIDTYQLAFAKSNLERRLQVERKKIHALPDLLSFVDTRSNSVVITRPRPVSILDPKRDLDRIFGEVVGAYRTETATRRRHHRVLRDAFRKLENEKRIERPKAIVLPSTNYHFHANYLYRNGTPNLIREFDPQVSDQQSIARAAFSIGSRAQWLLRRPPVGLEHVKVVVVSLTEPTAPDVDPDSAAGEIFTEYGVNFIPRAGIDDFVKKVEAEAKPLGQ